MTTDREKKSTKIPTKKPWDINFIFNLIFRFNLIFSFSVRISKKADSRSMDPQRHHLTHLTGAYTPQSQPVWALDFRHVIF